MRIQRERERPVNHIHSNFYELGHNKEQGTKSATGRIITPFKKKKNYSSKSSFLF